MEFHYMRRMMALGAVAVLTIASTAGAQAATGFRKEFLDNYAEVESKLMQLTTAIPADKQDWKPNKDVRSFCEVFMHIAYDNYLLGAAVGLTMKPEMRVANPEKCPANKADAAKAMKESFTAFRNAVTATKDADLEASFSLFGSSRTRRAWLLATAEHAGEHLGQLIAYARMNNVVPPWSK
jgi:uncharacterized damage-inducible protein DinB